MTSLELRTLVEQISDELRARVLDGRLAPNSRVLQEEIADELGVSRTPLREAFRRLEAEGWFQRHSRQGVVVAALSVTDAAQVSIGRLVFEPAAARIASVTHDEDAADRIIGLLAEQRELGSRAVKEFARLNEAFHLELYGIDQAAPFDELGRVVSHNWFRFARYHRKYLRSEEVVRRSINLHEGLVNAWIARDGAATEQLTAEHIVDSIVFHVRSLDSRAEADPGLIAIAARYGLEDRFC